MAMHWNKEFNPPVPECSANNLVRASAFVEILRPERQSAVRQHEKVEFISLSTSTGLKVPFSKACNPPRLLGGSSGAVRRLWWYWASPRWNHEERCEYESMRWWQMEQPSLGFFLNTELYNEEVRLRIRLQHVNNMKDGSIERWWVDGWMH